MQPLAFAGTPALQLRLSSTSRCVFSPGRRPRVCIPRSSRTILYAADSSQSSSTPRAPAVPSLPRVPRVRVVEAPLSEARRLQRVSGAVGAMYLPVIVLLVARVVATHMWPGLPLSVPERVLCAALLAIAPELMHSSFSNLRSCAQVARRANRVTSDRPTRFERSTERLVKPVRVHSVLTAVVAAGTLSGLLVSLFRPCSGSLCVLLFQTLFYLGRRVRFERRGRVYRCHSSQYRDIVWACGLAGLCVVAVEAAFFPVLAASAALTLALMFLIIKRIFVPSSARVF